MNPKFQNAKVVGSNISQKVYRAQPREGCKRGDPDYVMSRGELMEFMRCPIRWLRGAGLEDEDTDSTEFGSLVDCLVLEPSTFESRYAIRPEKYPSSTTGKLVNWAGQSTYCKAWVAEAEADGRLVIKPKTKAKADAALNSLMADPYAGPLIECSQRSVMVVAEYVDAKTGIVVPVKVLLDLVPRSDSKFGKCLADLKTAVSAEARAWSSACFSRGYDMQAALYTDIYVEATGEDRCDWRHVIVESEPPFQTGTRFMSEEFVQLGRARYQSALKMYASCLASGRWPRYEDLDPTAMVLDGYMRTEPLPWMLMSGMPSYSDPTWLTEGTPAKKSDTEDDDLIP